MKRLCLNWGEPSPHISDDCEGVVHCVDETDESGVTGSGLTHDVECL